MDGRQGVWAGVVLAVLLLLVVLLVAFQQVGVDPRFRTARRIIDDLNEHGLRCAAGSADLSPADAPIAVNAEHGCTVDGRQVRIVVVAAADGPARDRYLRWLTEQGGGGYFVLGDSWGVGGDFEWLARRVQRAIGGRVCAVTGPASAARRTRPARRPPADRGC
jgi:hypothetical protein